MYIVHYFYYSLTGFHFCKNRKLFFNPVALFRKTDTGCFDPSRLTRQAYLTAWSAVTVSCPELVWGLLSALKNNFTVVQTTWKCSPTSLGWVYINEKLSGCLTRVNLYALICTTFSFPQPSSPGQWVGPAHRNLYDSFLPVAVCVKQKTKSGLRQATPHRVLRQLVANASKWWS